MLTLAAIGLFIKRAFWFVIDNWKVFAVVGAIIALLILVGLAYRGCRKQATIDIKSVDKINKANETDRLKELEKVIVENQDVVKTVDERKTIAEANETEKQAEIFAKIQEADRKIIEAKNQGRDVTGPELECILVPENCK